MKSSRFSRVLFRHRSLILLALATPIAIAALSGGGFAPRSYALGAMLVGAGVGLRLWAVRCIGRGARVHRPHASTGLVAEGPYAWSRNPLYVAAALILAGLGLAAGLGWLALPLLPLTLLAYSPIVIIEERTLAALLGEEYERYAARVPRWAGWPRPAASPDVDSVPWREVLGREKRLVPGALLALLGVVMVHAGWLPLAGWAEGLGRLSNLGVTGVVVIVIVVVGVGQGIKLERHYRRRAARRTAIAQP